MQTSVIRAIAVLVLATASISGQQRHDIQRVAWLQGCWEMMSGRRTVEEQWMAPRGDSMMGISRTVSDGRLVDYELMIVREQDDVLTFEARPADQAPAVFLARTVTDSSVVFANPDRDFPQTIGYQRTGPDSLLAWIEGGNGGQKRRVEFPFSRTRCPGSD